MSVTSDYKDLEDKINTLIVSREIDHNKISSINTDLVKLNNEQVLSLRRSITLNEPLELKGNDKYIYPPTVSSDKDTYTVDDIEFLSKGVNLLKGEWAKGKSFFTKSKGAVNCIYNSGGNVSAVVLSSKGGKFTKEDARSLSYDNVSIYEESETGCFTKTTIYTKHPKTSSVDDSLAEESCSTSDTQSNTKCILPKQSSPQYLVGVAIVIAIFIVIVIVVILFCSGWTTYGTTSKIESTVPTQSPDPIVNKWQ